MKYSREAVLTALHVEKPESSIKSSEPPSSENGFPSLTDDLYSSKAEEHWQKQLERSRLELERKFIKNQRESPQQYTNVEGSCTSVAAIPMPPWVRSDLFKSVFAHSMSRLLFVEITIREDRISDAFDKTFQWVFSKPSNSTQVWSDFAAWLRSDDKLYWITGKAGSGKSTLMKHLIHHHTTRKCLSEWAHARERKHLITASFYLWNAGTEIQRTQEGLLRTLLYQALECYAAIASESQLLQWNAVLMSHSGLDGWTFDNLQQAFFLLLEDEDCKFCFFIDGLDEFEGDVSVILQLVHRISTYSTTKVCVSSRPWIVFEDEFSTTPHLMLQHLTYPDIVHYINSTLGSSPAFKELCSLAGEENFSQNLVEKIAKKSAGVFLWVVLAVRSLTSGLRDGDGLLELEKRLDMLPPELEDLFRKILHNFESQYFSDAAVLFCVMVVAPTPPTLLFMSFAVEESYVAMNAKIQPMDERLRLFRAVRMRRRLNSRCKGLLEVGVEPRSIFRQRPENSALNQSNDEDIHTPENAAMDDSISDDEEATSPDSILDMKKVDPRKLSDFVHARIEYLHRTVREFLERKDVWDQLLAALPSGWNPHSALSRAHLLRLKWIEYERLPKADRNVETQIWDDIFKVIRHSVIAESSGDAQSRILDALEMAIEPLLLHNGFAIYKADSMAELSRMRYLPVSQRSQYNPPTHQLVGMKPHFLQLMLRCGPPKYIKTRLSTLYTHPSTAYISHDSRSLEALLETATEEHHGKYYILNDKQIILRNKPDPEVIELLLALSRLSNSAKAAWRDRVQKSVKVVEEAEANETAAAEATKASDEETASKLAIVMHQPNQEERLKERVFTSDFAVPQPPSIPSKDNLTAVARNRTPQPPKVTNGHNYSESNGVSTGPVIFSAAQKTSSTRSFWARTRRVFTKKRD
jgi:energy-coupling factor transporter ATP-binding protein EcfA2